jgi:hypothetical protein
VVVANWQNVSVGVDVGVPPPEIYRGYAWVGVTTQRIAMEGQPSLGPGFNATSGLPEWDPERYGSLHHPGDAWSYDIFAGVAKTVAPGRVLGDVDPLDGLQPRLLLASGTSQSAVRLGSYLNIAHRFDEVFDGFLLVVHWGMCPPPPDQDIATTFTPREGGLTGGSARIRDDTGALVQLVCSESETLTNFPVRGDDSATFRFWEMAGTAHATSGGFGELQAASDGLDLLSAMPEGMQPNAVPWEYVSDAALRHLVAWADGGPPPPSFPSIDVEPGPPPVIRRDEWGNATGGLRLPDLAAATARHVGTNDTGPASALFGQTVPFTAQQLTARYPNAEAYLRTWDGAIDELLTAGLNLGPDVDELRKRGRRIAKSLFVQIP